MSQPLPNPSFSAQVFFERWRYVILFLITVIVTLISVHYLTNYYRLVQFPGYDDVTYFYDATQWIERFYHKGPFGILHYYLKNGAHAPVSIAQAFLGYLLFGYQTWAPYVLNGVIVFAMLLFSDRMVKRLPWPARLLCYLVVAVSPLLSAAVCDFRPDFFWGIVTAFGTLIAIKELWILRTPRYCLAWGALFGLSLILKPSTCMATTAFYGASVFISATMVFLIQRQAFKPLSLLRSIGWMLLAAAVIALPHYIVDFHNIVSYIYQALVTNKKVWDYTASPLQVLAYYSFGEAGRATLFKTVYLLLGIVAVSHITLWLRARFQSFSYYIAMTVMVAILYAVPTIVSLKNPFLGVGFSSGLIFLALAGIEAMYKTLIPHNQVNAGTNQVKQSCYKVFYGFLILIMVTAISLFHFPASNADTNSLETVRQNELFDTLYDAFKSHLTDIPRPHFMQGVEGPVIQGAFKLRAAFDRLPLVYFDSLSFAPDLKQALIASKNYDFIIAQEQGTAGASLNMPSSRYAGAFLNALEHNTNYQIIGQGRAMNGKRLELFQRITPYFGLHSRYGVHACPIDKICGQDGESGFTLQPALNQTKGQLKLAFKALKPLKQVQVYVDDKLLEVVPVVLRQHQTTVDVPISLSPSTASPHILRVVYSPDYTTEPPQQNNTDVEFTQLQFISDRSAH